MNDTPQQLLRQLPAVSKFLITERGRQLCERYGEEVTKFALKTRLEELRKGIRENSKLKVPDEQTLADELNARLHRLCDAEARRAINATGIILHTALGRAPFSENATRAVTASTGYCIVQVDPETNLRSQRDEKIEAMLQELTGCEAATTLTNNAAATFLLLHVMGAGKEVILSRGQLVEIGGEFRMPDVMAASGVIMKEVGTTNRTHLRDYESAISDKTAALLYVHPSNYEVQGFSATPSIEELSKLGVKYKLPVIADLGSGALVSLAKYKVRDAITIQDALRAGAAVTCSSGDKLICGPQAGIVCGNLEIVQKIRKSPFARMFRTDKMVLAALEATLLDFVRGGIERSIPLYQMLSVTVDELEQRAKQVIGAISGAADFSAAVEDGSSYVGGGSLPTEELPTKVVALSRKSGAAAPDASALARQLRLSVPPVFCRVNDEKLIFDMRTLLAGDVERLSAVLSLVVAGK